VWRLGELIETQNIRAKIISVHDRGFGAGCFRTKGVFVWAFGGFPVEKARETKQTA
jgi:hypothetical protein